MFFVLSTIFGGLASGLQSPSSVTRTFTLDGGMPVKHLFSSIHPAFKVPVNALLLEGLFVICYGLVMLGSSLAFMAAISSQSMLFIFTYAFPQAIVLFRGRDILPDRYFHLGKFGYFINASSVLFCSLYLLLFCFPQYKDITLKI